MLYIKTNVTINKQNMTLTTTH